MTDIVKRLRARKHMSMYGAPEILSDPLCQEAADEIERLRAESAENFRRASEWAYRWWLKTGEPAGPEESRAIYTQLCRAVRREPQP